MEIFAKILLVMKCLEMKDVHLTEFVKIIIYAIAALVIMELGVKMVLSKGDFLFLSSR